MLWFLLLVARVKALNVLPSGYEDSLVNCVEYIADKYLMSHCLAFLFPLNFSNPSVVDVPLLVRSDLLKNLHRKWAPCLPAVNNHKKNFIFEESAGPINRLQCAHIVIFNDHNSYVNQMKQMIYTGFNYYYENGGGSKTRMVLVAPFEVKESDIHKVLYLMYEQGDIDVIYVGVKQEVVTVFTFFPFGENGKSCPEEANFKILDFWVNGSFLGDVDLFPDKMPSRFNHCTIQLSTTNVPPFIMLDDRNRPNDGFDYRMVQLITNQVGLNANYNVYDRVDGLFWMEGEEPRGSIIDLRKGEVWMSVPEGTNSIFIFPSVYVPHFHMTGELSWHFQNPEHVPKWKLLYQAFNYLMWLFCIGAIVVFSFSVFILVKFSGDAPSFSRCLLASCSIAVGNAIILNPKSNGIRLALGSWLLGAFHINLAYVVSITGLITVGKVEPKIETFDQIIQRNLITATKPHLSPFANLVDIPEIRKVLSNQVEIKDYDITFHRMQKYGDVCILDLDNILSYNINKKKLSIYKSNLKLSSLYFGILIKRNHFFAERLLNISSHIYETGLALKLLNEYTMISWNIESITHSKAYTIEDLKGAFLVLIIGEFLAFLVFTAELLCVNISKVKNGVQIL